MRSYLKNRATVSSTARAPSSEAFQNVPDMASPHASNKGGCFKENINIQKSETPKLALEPQQMKRKKKGGGYNLRKSLAWDRAFFTEEGVLDPLELSVISGASCREGVPFINEDPNGSQLSVKPVSRQKIETNLLKELEDEDFGKDRKKDWSSVKLSSSSSNFITSIPLASHKDPTHIGSKSGPRRGDCPRPLPLSSLKRPANANVGKAAGKELKLPKVTGLKPGPSPSCETTKSNIPRASHVKHNQITQSELQSCSKNLKNTQDASKASSLKSACSSDGNILQRDLSFRGHSSIKKSPVLVDKANSSGPKMISDSMTSARPVPSSVGQYEPTTFTASFSQNGHDSARTMHHLQNQTIKPSGLRMPSPSLSFFSQPKCSVLRDLPLRNAETDVCGFQKPRNLSLQDNLRRTTKADISSNALSSITEYTASPHVSTGELIKSNLKRNSIQKVAMKFQDHSENNITERISKEEAELQKVDIEVPSHSQSGSDKQVMGDRSEGRRPEVRSEWNYAIHESEKISVTDVPHKGKNRSNLLVLNHGAIKGTQFEDAFDHRVQNSLEMRSEREETSKPDSHESNTEQTDPSRYPAGDTDETTHEDKNLSKTIERASEQQGASQQNGSCDIGNASVEVLEHEPVKAENSCVVSKNLPADLLKEAACAEVLAGNLQAGDAHMQNALCASAIRSSKNSVNLISEVADDTGQSGKCSEIADDTNQSGKCSEVPDICTEIEIDLHKNARLNTIDSLLPDKQICLQESHQGKGVEKLLCEVPERKDVNEVIKTKVANPQLPGKMHDCSSDKMIRPIVSTELGPIDNFLSSERQIDLISMISNHDGKHHGNGNLDASLSETVMSFVAAVGRAQDDGDLRSNESENVLLNSSDSVNLSNNLHQDNQSQRTEIDCNSSFHESRASEVSLKNIPGKVAEVGLIIQDGSANNWLVSTISIKESEVDLDNPINVRDSRTGLVQLPESNMLNKQSEHLALDNAEFVAENLACNNEGLHFEDCLLTRSLPDESCEDNALGSTEDSVTGQNEILLCSLENPCVSVKESPFKHEICNDACLTGGQSPVTDTIADSSRFKPTEVCEDTNNSFNCPHPELEVKVEAALEPNNNNGDGVNEKSRSFVLPQNAIPFSDEWLAAIEAAGEDILTRKGGAVQNSPPDKSLPEPSPWSPVKRKNNPIGPFDCTKKFNIPSSESS